MLFIQKKITINKGGWLKLNITKICYKGNTRTIYQMSKLISVKMDENLLKETDAMVKKLGMSRNKYVNEAVAEYTKAKKRAELEEQIIKASFLVRESSMEVLREFEALDDDYETI